MKNAQDAHTLPLVEEILTIPEFAHAEPEIFASERARLAPVRWAHVVAGIGSSTLLDGQECVLTTGAGWPTSGPHLTHLITELCDAGMSALVFELGPHFPTAPVELRQVCESRDVALVILHREVKFVQITQRIHRRILGAQNEALQAKERVHQLFTELGLNRSPVDFMVEQIAATLSAPVVLENSAGQVITWSSPHTSTPPHEVLAPWLGGSAPASADATRVAVEAQGTRWGTLTALPGPEHPAGRQTVLELGAIALALSRLATDGDEWVQYSSKRLIDTLLTGRYRTDTDLRTQLVAGGLPFTNRTLFPLTLAGTGDFDAHVSLERAVLETALRRAIAPEGNVIITQAPLPDLTDTHHTLHAQQVSLCAIVSLPHSDRRIDFAPAIPAIPATPAAPTLAERFARELDMLAPTTTPQRWRAHLSLGMPTGNAGHEASVRGLLSSLEGVLAAGILAPSATIGRVSVQLAARQPLAYLLRDFSGVPSLQRYVDDVLGPLIEHDRVTGPGHSGDLVRVLGAYLAHPTNRSLAATEARLSRSVFYQRLALIEQLLRVDLADGTTITTLTVAHMAHAIHS